MHGRRRSRCGWGPRPTRWRAASPVSGAGQPGMGGLALQAAHQARAGTRCAHMRAIRTCVPQFLGHGRMMRTCMCPPPARLPVHMYMHSIALLGCMPAPCCQCHPCLPLGQSVAHPLLSTHPTCPAAAGAGHRPIRIDYILATGRPLQADLVLTDTGHGFSYSDHLGVAATLDLLGSNSSSSNGNDDASNGGSDGSKSSGPADGGKQQGHQARQPLAPPSAALRLMRAFPEPFQEAAAQIEEAAAVMARGRRHAVGFAAGLFAAGFGCLGALAARAWEQPARHGWQQGDNYLLLLGGMGAALGWAGAYTTLCGHEEPAECRS